MLNAACRGTGADLTSVSHTDPWQIGLGATPIVTTRATIRVSKHQC